MAFILYYLKYILEVSQTLDYIHRFLYIRLMKGHATGGATFHQGVLLDYVHYIPFKNNFRCQWNRVLIKMWSFTMCVMHSQLQFVPTHISVQVVRGGDQNGVLRNISGAHSVKSIWWQQQPCFLSMYSLENIITYKYFLHEWTFLANILDFTLDLWHLFFAN